MRSALVLAVASIATGCTLFGGSATPTATVPIPTVAPSPSPSPTAPPTAPPSSGPPAADCVDGWTAPAAGSPGHEEALDLIRGQMGVAGDFRVDEMRYFTGPDVPWIIDPFFEVVRRWYVKATLAGDATFRGRWILEWREPGREGISAVAPFDTRGYASPDWRGFVGDGPPRAIEGLPGEWPGLEYDFVTGEGDGGFPGLPDEVVGCLEGT